MVRNKVKRIKIKKNLIFYPRIGEKLIILLPLRLLFQPCIMEGHYAYEKVKNI
jgi:hypothetical protein